jgi:hypothetical protein
MPALTKNYECFERPGLVVSYRVSNVKIFKGSLVGLNASGHLVPMLHTTSGPRFVGIANELCDNTGGTAGQKFVNVTKSGSFVYTPVAGFSPTVADLGKEAFAQTDNDVQVATAGLTTQYKVGTIVALEQSSTGVSGLRIRIDNYTV